MDPKPPRRIKDPAAVHAVVVSHPQCQICHKQGRVFSIGGRTWVVGVSGHHIVPKSQRGDDVWQNILVVCGHGTAGCHGQLEARKLETQRLARAAMTEEQEEYIVRKKGWVYLERTYPRGRERMQATQLRPTNPHWAEIDRAGWPA